MTFAELRSVDAAREALATESYLADRPLALAVHLAMVLEQPLLLEGEAGVGKTEVARALAGATGARLIRLQCHEGIDLHHAVYDWDYARQLLALRAAEAGVEPGVQGELFSRRFLLRRPLLEALESDRPVVLLIDEIDRADDEFEAFLLEFLSDFAVTIPELGTIAASQRPVVILTSNRTRSARSEHRTVRRARRESSREVQSTAASARCASTRSPTPTRDPCALKKLVSEPSREETASAPNSSDTLEHLSFPHP